jgi:hypothetical protein
MINGMIKRVSKLDEPSRPEHKILNLVLYPPSQASTLYRRPLGPRHGPHHTTGAWRCIGSPSPGG